MNLTESERNGLVHSEDFLPLPVTKAGILDTIKKILRRPAIQQVVIDATGYIKVDWFRAISDSLTLPDLVDSTEVVLARIDLESVEIEKDLKSTLIDLLIVITDESGIYLNSFIAGSLKFLAEALSFSLTEKIAFIKKASMLSVPIYEDRTIPEDTLVVCFSPFKEGTLSDVTYGIKLNIGELK